MPPSQESEVHPASIVINVTTTIKPSAQPEAGPYGAGGPDSSDSTTQQVKSNQIKMHSYSTSPAKQQVQTARQELTHL